MTHEKLVGSSFGRLTVQRIIPGHYIKAECICECGALSIPLVSSLLRGSTKSCGCYRKESTAKRMTVYSTPIEAKQRSLFIAYGHGAKNRRLIFALDYESFCELVLHPCHYCDIKPNPFNGLDRVDSAIGYTVSNCVACCPICNRAKGNMPYAAFLEYLSRFSRIHENLKTVLAG